MTNIEINKMFEEMCEEMFEEIKNERFEYKITSKTSIVHRINFYFLEKIIFPLKNKIYSFYLNVLGKIYCR